VRKRGLLRNEKAAGDGTAAIRDDDDFFEGRIGAEFSRMGRRTSSMMRKRSPACFAIAAISWG